MAVNIIMRNAAGLIVLGLSLFLGESICLCLMSLCSAINLDDNKLSERKKEKLPSDARSNLLNYQLRLYSFSTYSHLFIFRIKQKTSKHKVKYHKYYSIYKLFCIRCLFLITATTLFLLCSFWSVLSDNKLISSLANKRKMICALLNSFTTEVVVGRLRSGKEKEVAVVKHNLGRLLLFGGRKKYVKV